MTSKNMDECKIRTLLETIWQHAMLDNNYEILYAMASNGTVNVNHTGANRKTALMYACRSGVIRLVNLLCTAPGIQINHRDNNGDTALHAAVCMRFPATPDLQLDVLAKLLQHTDINIHLRNKQLYTPLEMACTAQKPHVVSMLYTRYVFDALLNHAGVIKPVCHVICGYVECSRADTCAIMHAEWTKRRQCSATNVTQEMTI